MGSSEARISSVKKAINIIELLRNNDDATTKEVAEALDISKTSAYYYLQTLSESGYVVNDDGRYSLSLQIFTLGADIRSRQPVYRNICGQVNRLANKTGELSLFMLAEEGMGTYVYMSRGKNAGIKSDWLGNRCHLHNNALGKAILSVLPKNSVREIIRDHGLPKSTENTITEKKPLFNELSKIRKRGVAFDHEEQISGLQCVAAPVVDINQDNQSASGAICIACPTSRMDRDRRNEEFPRLVQDAANVIQLNQVSEER